ncbi:putative Rho GTPase-activating protein [Halotydeus destructor]|nr:putative Rho GTPase-activating protein [Halotydeus destructor]
MRRVVAVYKDWINGNVSQVPMFMEEPVTDSDHEVRVGMSKVLQSFITNSSNIFLVQVPMSQSLFMEEQVDMCKRILNIYRYMVMKVEMDKETWEQLLLVMLYITSQVLAEAVPSRREESLGGRLAPAFFQTLIVTWIRANINVCISQNLWEHFQSTISKQTHWEELIKEWSKTMDTITRVMSRTVYNINLHDLPLERVSDKRDRRRKTVHATNSDAAASAAKANANRVESAGQGKQEIHRKRSNSGGRSDHDWPRTGKVRRSLSDSKLLSEIRKNQQTAELVAAKIIPAPGTFARSLEFISRQRVTSQLLESPNHSRSPSPTPSSGMDTNSLKDSPLNFDGVSLNSNASSSAGKCVISGGSHRGWAADSAVILWRRMLGILGDVNNLRDPIIHAQVIECLGKIVEDLLKVRENSGIETHPASSSSLLVPPINFCSPWLFRALTLGPEFKRGKLIAYKTLSLIFLRRYDVPPFPDSLCHFYKAIHRGLASKDPDITNVIVRFCATKLFAVGLPGSTCLLLPMLDAAESVLNPEGNIAPRFEALSLLGALTGLSNFYENIPHTSLSFDGTSRKKEIKEQILTQLLKSSKREPSGMGRSIALNCLGLYVYQELTNKNGHSKIKEVIDVLISATKFTYRVLSRVACDMLRLQCDHVVYLLDNHQDIPRKIIEGLASSLLAHVNAARKGNSMREYKDTILTIIMCLSEWCLCVPREFLTSMPIDGSYVSLLSIVATVLSRIVSETGRQSVPATPETTPTSPDAPDMDFTVFADAMDNGAYSAKKPFVDENALLDDAEGHVVRLAAQMCLGHFLNHVGHFPRQYLCASKLNCGVNENDENVDSVAKNEETEELSAEIFSSPNTLFFVANNSCIISFTELPDSAEEHGVYEELFRKVRIIVRDLHGKFAWDCSALTNDRHDHTLTGETLRQTTKETRKQPDDDYDSDTHPHATQEDMIDSVLKIVSLSSPECGLNRKRSGPFPVASLNFAQAEENMIALLLNQHYQEMNFMEHFSDTKIQIRNLPEPDSLFSTQPSHFQVCRQLIDQLGFMSWERRAKVELLGKNDKVLRELRNLDKQHCRETHKIAVIYVGEGQEDKNSILLNKSASKMFETFVSGLGWEIDLEKHLGFRGGLQRNKSTGSTTAYYATAMVEVVYHVSTRIPACLEDTDSLTKKLRHLGNDEIHIIWSEHWRDYRRDIIPTEFGDVIIVIYPVPSLPEYYRIHIFRKPEVPFFGPLYTGSVVHIGVLAGLVRATAINASRAQRQTVSFYQNFYEERARCIENIVRSQDARCFEDFALSSYSPLPLGLLAQSASRPVSSLSNVTTTDSMSMSSLYSSHGSESAHGRLARNRPTSMGTGLMDDQRASQASGGLRPLSANAPLQGQMLSLSPR